MGMLDDFIQKSATPLLRPGEQIQAKAHLRIKPRTTGTTGQTYKDWLVAATNQRLLFFPAKETLTLAIAPGGSGDPFTVELRDLFAVWLTDRVGLVGDYRRMTLVPIRGRGPLGSDGRLIDQRIDLGYLANHNHALVCDLRSETTGLDEQRSFHRDYPGWLEQQVTARVLWGPEEHAAAEAERVAIAKEAELERLAAEKRAQAVVDGVNAVKRKLPLMLPVLLLLAGLGVTGACALLLVDGLERADRDAKQMESTRKRIALREADIEWRRAGKNPPKDCPGKGLPYWEGCHGCQVRQKEPYEKPDGWLVVEVGREFWVCPPLDDYEKDQERDRGLLQEQQEQAQTTTGLAAFGAGAGAGLLLMVGGIMWLVRLVRRRRREG
jgi:hypothetical protein